ncbi:unnamed protein product [Rangifer tarandus platyrhynchus]|uniref:Uncharacterized protein n=1 Tax=Rangifer tarandus platyrhynchus TaxID=3082113 RepID=A0ABN8ZZQ3_RANTA|nr:unnamed protein product [Rangifer tarandus platyrhynchus]
MNLCDYMGRSPWNQSCTNSSFIFHGQPDLGFTPYLKLWEHNRCEFQHIGLPPRAPTAIRRPSGQARASVSRIRIWGAQVPPVAGPRLTPRA